MFLKLVGGYGLPKHDAQRSGLAAIMKLTTKSQMETRLPEPGTVMQTAEVSMFTLTCCLLSLTILPFFLWHYNWLIRLK